MKKMLLWDGDLTLWNGTILDGEDPVIPDTHLALCEELFNRGVLQALVTRNLWSDVEAIIYRYSLNRWFLHDQADLSLPKSLMISNIIAAYNISRPSDIVFVDDLEYNHAEVRSVFPDILCIHPKDLQQTVEQHFTKAEYSAEDQMRVRSYQSEKLRLEAAKSYGNDRIAFLKSCEMQMHVTAATPSHKQRIVDLFTRANQTAAFSPAFRLEDLDKYHVLAASVSDKFGNYGVIGAIVQEGSTILGLAISCRLQGRGVGSALLGYLVKDMTPPIRAKWKKTPYNSGVKLLYEWYGFEIAERADGGSEDGFIRALLESPTIKELPEWITIS